MPIPAQTITFGKLPSEDEIREDPRACYLVVRQQMEALSASGQDIPDDLIRLDRSIQVECIAQSQGR